MQRRPEILELIEGRFERREWADFVRLTVREICRRPFVLKACGLYFVGDGRGTDIGRLVERKHPGRVRHLIEWLEIVLPFWSSALMDWRLIDIKLREIADGDASEVLSRIQGLARRQAVE